ncbi:MAG TPA: DUF1579 family protein [Bacteroidota bacterium]
MNMPQLTEAHQQLQLLVGNWVGQEKINPSPWDPLGGPAIGRVKNKLALNGFAVVQQYEQERNGAVNFRGHGIFTWFEPEKCYMLHWFDSFGATPNVMKGQFEKNVLTLTSKGSFGHSKAVFDFSEDGQYYYRMDVSEDGTEWYTFMEGTYEKKD